MKKLQHPRGNTASNDIYTGLESQLTVDTSRWELRLHDAETPGGHRILNLAQLIEIFMQLDSEFGGVSFAPDARGYLVRVGDRQYALREIVAGSGIVITEGKATGGNTTIAISPNFLDAGIMAGKLPYALTTGTASALLADLPTGWPNDVNGAVAILKLHVAPANGATLKVDDYTARNLLTARGSNKLATAMKINDIIMVVRVGDNFHAIGVDIPANINIEAIVGLTALDIQAALAELLGKIPGTGGSTADPFNVLLSVGPMGSMHVDPITHTLINLADGQYRFVIGNSLVPNPNGEGQNTWQIPHIRCYMRLGANYWMTTGPRLQIGDSSFNWDVASGPGTYNMSTMGASFNDADYYRTYGVWTNLGAAFSHRFQESRVTPAYIGTEKAAIWPGTAAP